ncbi:uncharacterized protein ACO6RY_12225 [Pungitius sinensis]
MVVMLAPRPHAACRQRVGGFHIPGTLRSLHMLVSIAVTFFVSLLCETEASVLVDNCASKWQQFVPAGGSM